MSKRKKKVRNLREGDRVETNSGAGTVGELFRNSRSGTIYRVIKLDNGKETSASGGKTLTLLSEGKLTPSDQRYKQNKDINEEYGI